VPRKITGIVKPKMVVKHKEIHVDVTNMGDLFLFILFSFSFVCTVELCLRCTRTFPQIKFLILELAN